MNIYFRIQGAGIPFDAMRNYNSCDGGDGGEEGLCACLTVADLMCNTAWDASDDDEVIIFEADRLEKIYDGYRVRPTKELARFTRKYVVEHEDEIAEYEDW